MSPASTSAALQLLLQHHPDLVNAKELVTGRLFFAVAPQWSQAAPSLPHYHFFCIDHRLSYTPFFDDFGPLNLGQTHGFSYYIHHHLARSTDTIIVYCLNAQESLTNAAALLGCFLVIDQQQTVDKAYEPFHCFEPFQPFRDASQNEQEFSLVPVDVIRAMDKAIKNHFYNFHTFNVTEYEHYETVDHGDLNVIVPNKFLALAGPVAKSTVVDGIQTFSPVEMLPILQKFNVRAIVRLNKKVYSSEHFVTNGIKHYELFFADGSSPSLPIIEQFFRICDSHSDSGVIGVHCKAGLGRTGTLIGLWLMRHYRFTASESIAWVRLCRPGSIIGEQQNCMVQHQATMHRWFDRHVASKISVLSPRLASVSIAHSSVISPLSSPSSSSPSAALAAKAKSSPKSAALGKDSASHRARAKTVAAPSSKKSSSCVPTPRSLTQSISGIASVTTAQSTVTVTAKVD